MKTIIAAAAALATLGLAGYAQASVHLGAQPPFHRHHHRHAPATPPADTPPTTTILH